MVTILPVRYCEVEIMDADGPVLNAESKKFCSRSNVDRLSSLPEAIISHILSFLPAKDGVKTSALSTKWIYMWTTVTTVDLNGDLVLNGHGRNKKERFMNFVDRVLLLVNPIIHNFYLSLAIDFDAYRVHSWLSDVIRRKVQKLHIKYHPGKSFVFPRCLYSSDSLTELKVDMFCTFRVPTSICFSRLEILQLSNVTFCNESFLCSSELHFSFPCLQTLNLDRCKWQNVKVIDIDAPLLHSFSTTDYYGHYCVPDRVKNRVIKIRASSITKFECYGYASAELILSSPSSVIYATISVNRNNTQEQVHKMALHTCMILKLFTSLKYLKVCSTTIWALASLKDLQDHLPTLNNLIQLTNSGNNGLHGTFVALLQRLPVLESLILTWESVTCLNIEVVPPCFQTHLKFVKFQCFDGTERGIEFAKFFLKNAMVLVEMIFIADSVLKYRSESEIQAVKEKLLAFPRGSDIASISFN